MKRFSLLFNFYSHYLISSIIVNLWCLSIFFTKGISTFFPLFWFKVATLALTVLFINKYRYQQFYFYKNLGLGKWQLWRATLTLDLLLFIALSSATLYMR